MTIRGYLLFSLCILSLSTFAQSGTMLPDGFIIPNLSIAPGCTATDKGKIYFNTTGSLLMYCDGTNWKPASSQWSNSVSPAGAISYNGFVGINTSTPQYRLDVNGDGKFTGQVFANTIGIGTTTPSANGLNVVDGDIAITSTADAKTWKFDYSDANNNLTLQENGIARMVFANGGNVAIGAITPTAKLTVDGSGSFSGDLSVNNGKGIVRSTTATPLKFHIATASTGASFSVIAGMCATVNSALTSAGFTAVPTVTVGNLTSGTGDFGKLVTNIQSTTVTQATIRFCNPTASDITLNNIVFNLLCIGQ